MIYDNDSSIATLARIFSTTLVVSWDATFSYLGIAGSKRLCLLLLIMKEPALMTRTRWHYEWLVHIVCVDGLKRFGQTAAAVYTGTVLAFADGSVWADELDVSICDKDIDARFLWVRVRAPRRTYVGESSWSLHKLPVRIYRYAT